MKLVTIKTFVYPHEATMAMHMLEDNGIESFLMDELSIQINPIYSNTLGGAKLQVWEQDAEQALLLLAQNDISSVDDVAQTLEERDIETETNTGAAWLTYKNIGFLFLFLILLVVLLKAFKLA